jgi:hypothetical protein
MLYRSLILLLLCGCAHQKPKSVYAVIPLSCVTEVETQPALCAVSGNDFECNKVHVKASCIKVKEEK